MGVPSVPIAVGQAPEAEEQQHVHDVYNEIASHFSQTRYKPWPVVEQFLLAQPDHSVGLDVGCGNGKYMGVNPKITVLGSDRSSGLVECAWRLDPGRALCVADGLLLPHPAHRFDFAILIAVIHHFSTEERRIEAIAHILLRLRAGGRLLVFCWALEQALSRRGYKEGGEQDLLVPWVLQGKKDVGPETKYRFYHLYKEGELEANARAAGGVVVRSGYERDNWWTEIEAAGAQ